MLAICGTNGETVDDIEGHQLLQKEHLNNNKKLTQVIILFYESKEMSI